MAYQEDNTGVPLAHYRQHEANVELTCLGCQGRRSFDLETVIRRLEARGVGSAQTGIRGIARFVREPCPRCGGTRFESRPGFQPITKEEGWRSPAPEA